MEKANFAKPSQETMEFDGKQVEFLIVVGLWCCYPDPSMRPSIKQVTNALNFEHPLPNLPSEFLVPRYSTSLENTTSSDHSFASTS